MTKDNPIKLALSVLMARDNMVETATGAPTPEFWEYLVYFADRDFQWEVNPDSDWRLNDPRDLVRVILVIHRRSYGYRVSALDWGLVVLVAQNVALNWAMHGLPMRAVATST